MLSWILFVPVRYHMLDMPRDAGETGDYDPQGLWPLEGTPVWMMPIWIVLHLGAWTAVFGGLFLLPCVVLTGIPPVLRRSRGRRGRLLGAAMTAMVMLVAAMWSMSVGGVWLPGLGALLDAGVNGVRATGVLGILAVLCAVRIHDLSRRVRVGLVVVGAAAAGMAVWTYTSAGHAMLMWFMD